MHGVKLISALLILLAAGCAGLASGGRVETFQQEEKIYRQALRDSDFKKANKYLAPEAKASFDQIRKYRYIVVVRYKRVEIKPSKDRTEIRQEVEIEYYDKTRPVVNVIQDFQVWTWDPKKKVYLLQTGLPNFQ